MKADIMNEKTIELSPLPEPAAYIDQSGECFPQLQGDVFTADQMHAYLLTDRASRSRAASEPGEVARLAEVKLGAFACVKRAAEPDNEFAACRSHCGNDDTCLRTPTAQEKTERDELRELVLLIRKLLNSPGESWSHKAAEAIMSVHPAYSQGFSTTREAPTDAQLDELARQWSHGAPIVLCYDGESRPIDGLEFSLPRFRSAVRSALASMATSPASEALTPQQREDILVKAGAICDGGMSHDDFGLEIIDQVERHYGICAHGAGSISKS